MSSKKERLVVIGNGMAGARVVEEILERDPDRFEISMLGAEPYGNYNRILLSHVLNGSQAPTDIFLNPLAWYDEKNIHLVTGVRAEKIDRKRRVIVTRKLKRDAPAYSSNPAHLDDGMMEIAYDRVIIATGSRPFVPPMQGLDGPGLFLFRTLDDCSRIADYARECHSAAVIGGGLLGLEAARGLMTHGVEVSVIEAGPRLMRLQLDSESGGMLRNTIEAMGIKVLTDKITQRIVRGEDGVTGLEFADGSTLATDMVVISTGIRPIAEIAGESDLACGRGITVDDQMRTSDPAIFALGECVEHRGVCYGLVDPIWKQAEVLADVITETNASSAYIGSRIATKLKVMGVDLVSMGETDAKDEHDDVISYREPRYGVYKKLIVRNGRLAGAILLGAAEEADSLLQVFVNDRPVPARPADLLFGATSVTALMDADDLPDTAQVCNCNGVSAGKIRACVKNGCTSVMKVGAATKAGLGCGSCKAMVARIIESCAGEVGYDETEHYYVPGVALEKSRLVAEIQKLGLKSVSAVFRELAEGKEDAASKAGLASLLKTLWHDEYDDERDARFINDRVHANIQNDGTFSVVPRIYGGVTTPAELRRIADVAEKYEVRMVKITGGQRIDLLGIKKSDLPGVWKDLGMPSGHAYTKGFRTCKSCVGSEFCRYGLGDAVKMAQEIERRFQGIESPHKMKLAAAGCPRNCSEALVKDIGVVAIEGGLWEIVVGGAAGGKVRKGDLLTTVASREEVLLLVGRFIQYYREHGKYLERTYDFVERVGIETVRKIVVEDSLGIAARLDAEIQKAVDAYFDPWKEAETPVHSHQFAGLEAVEVENASESRTTEVAHG